MSPCRLCPLLLWAVLWCVVMSIPSPVKSLAHPSTILNPWDTSAPTPTHNPYPVAFFISYSHKFTHNSASMRDVTPAVVHLAQMMNKLPKLSRGWGFSVLIATTLMALAAIGFSIEALIQPLLKEAEHVVGSTTKAPDNARKELGHKSNIKDQHNKYWNSAQNLASKAEGRVAHLEKSLQELVLSSEKLMTMLHEDLTNEQSLAILQSCESMCSVDTAAEEIDQVTEELIMHSKGGLPALDESLACQLNTLQQLRTSVGNLKQVVTSREVSWRAQL